MGCVEGSGVPVLYIGRTVPKGEYNYTQQDGILKAKRKKTSANNHTARYLETRTAFSLLSIHV
jgi:hypothetical protein